MRTAIIEILVAEYATPIRVAYALPTRAVAIAMLASGIRCTLIAKFTSPTVSALAFAAYVAMTVNRMATLFADG